MKTTSLEDAVSHDLRRASIMIGGFMGAGTPERLIDELVRQGKRDLRSLRTTRQAGQRDRQARGAGLVSRAIASHIGLNPETQQ